MNTEIAESTTMEVVTKASPPVGVSVAMFAGIPVQTWVLWLTFIYVVLQLFFLLRDKIWRPWRKSKDGA